MTSRRTVAVAGTALVLAAFSGAPAFAHGSMTDPVSRVAACYAEGPESPDSAACRAAVAASGPQAFYDWNAVNIAAAAGRHRALIPDGKLCSAGNDKYRGLDLARADWPASPLAAGKHTFRYKGTAPHKGTFSLYVTRDGYDPAKPLTWADLEEKPFLTVTDPRMEGGDYVFEGAVPERSGRHLVYSIWQRSDSPEAFYTCSDVVFGGEGGSGGGGAAPSASAPTDTQIEEGAEESSVEHGGHGDHDASTGAGATAAAPEPAAETAPATAAAPSAEPAAATPTEPAAAATPSVTASAAPAPAPAGGSVELAETGGSSVTPYLALGGAGVLAAGAAVLFRTTRRRAR